jgi:hypothetical protein
MIPKNKKLVTGNIDFTILDDDDNILGSVTLGINPYKTVMVEDILIKLKDCLNGIVNSWFDSKTNLDFYGIVTDSVSITYSNRLESGQGGGVLDVTTLTLTVTNGAIKPLTEHLYNNYLLSCETLLALTLEDFTAHLTENYGLIVDTQSKTLSIETNNNVPLA